MDIAELLERAPWDTLRWHITNGEHPSTKELADAIRQNPHITVEMVGYVAGRIDGSVRAPAHRGAKRQTLANRRARAKWLELDVRPRQAAFRILGIQAPRLRALHVVKEQSPWAPGSVDTLSDLLKLVKSPPIAWWEERVKRWEAEGRVRLDREEGVVWLLHDESDET